MRFALRTTTIACSVLCLGLAVSVGPALADLASGRVASAEPSATDLDRELERINHDLTSAGNELNDLRTKLQQQNRQMTTHVRAYYRLVHAGLLPLSSGFDSLITHSTRVERLRMSLERDVAMARALNDRLSAVAQHKQKLADRKGPIEIQQKALERARSALMEADDRERAFDRAFSSSTGADYMAVYGASASPDGLGTGPDDGLSSAMDGFRSMKGRLPFPLAGRAEVQVVPRTVSGGPGVLMRAPAGTAVRSAFAGRVAFADEYASFGRVVILDHGDNYFTVSGQLGSIETRVGDEVGAGAKIGTVGVMNGKPALYFEIRHGADALDPGPWMGL